MTPKERKILQEYLKRFGPRPTLRTPDFHKQNSAIDDPAKLRAWNCTRRAGKSTGAAIDLVETMEAFPRMKNLYLALTLGSARGILWDEIVRMNEEKRLGLIPNEKYSLWKHPNGSTLQFFGMDATKKEMQKVLGQKYKKVFIDESGSMTIDMRKLCYQSLEPALMDLNGQLTIIGTCENIPNTFFQKVTQGEEKRWSIHKWTTADNPHMKDKWATELKKMLDENPLIVHTSWFRTHYLNEWCQDDDLLIIPFHEDRNEVDSLPSGIDWSYVLGVDLGFNDATSFSVLAFSPYHPICYRVAGWKEKGLILSRAGEEIIKLREKYDFFRIVIDGANKQGVEDLKQRMGLPLVNAEKTGKAIYLKGLKDDMVTGKFKAIRGANDSWIVETRHLQWSDTTQTKEDPRCDNHENDGTLYAWRECKHYIYEAPEVRPKDGTDEFMRAIEKKMAEDLQAKIQEEQDQWMHNNFESY